MRTKYVLIVLTALLIASLCTNIYLYMDWKTKEFEKTNENKTVDTEIEESGVLSDSRYQEIWDANSINGPDYFTGPIKIDISPIYLDGLNHKNSDVRWYCLNMMYDYLNYSYNDKVLQSIENLLEDKVDYVRECANLTLSAFKKEFSGSTFYKSHDGISVAFYRFSNARRNDGVLYIYNSKLNYYTSKQLSDGSIENINWSPNDNLLCINYNSPVSNYIIVYNIDEDIKYGDFFNKLLKTAELEEVRIPSNFRTYDTIELLDWSSDSKKILVFYNFPDIDEHYYRGKAVIDIQKNKITKVIPENSKSIEEVKNIVDFQW